MVVPVPPNRAGNRTVPSCGLTLDLFSGNINLAMRSALERIRSIQCSMASRISSGTVRTDDYRARIPDWKTIEATFELFQECGLFCDDWSNEMPGGYS